jgi:hypothetical protein
LKGDPARFEWRGSRIGHRVEEKDGGIVLTWKCPLFPSLLCLGIALLLLFPSFFVVKGIWLRASGPAASLWYFPAMNLVLLGIGIYLLSLRRQVVFKRMEKGIRFTRLSLFDTEILLMGFHEVARAEVATDLVRIGFMLIGGGDKEGYPIPALRLVLRGGHTVLVERGRKATVVELGGKISRVVGCPLVISDQ